MKRKSIIAVLIGITAVITVALLIMFFSGFKKNVEVTNDQVTLEQEVEDKDSEDTFEDTQPEEETLDKEEETTSSNSEANEISSDKDQGNHDGHHEQDGHDHSSASAEEYKSEDIISSYFAAITLGNSNALNQLFPSGKVENEQLALLLQNSTIVADIVDMEKLSIKDNKAEYTVVVKLHTREADDNFTDNKTTYKLVLDLTNGVITSKTTVNTEYLE